MRLNRIILDTNIFGQMVLDPRLELIKETLSSRKNFVIYGCDLIRKELRATPIADHISRSGIKNLRITLLNCYHDIVRKELSRDKKSLDLAEQYYKVYSKLGKPTAKEKILTDFQIVALASLNKLDLVVSGDQKTFLSENSIKAYNIVNDILTLRTPSFVHYEKFKEMLNI